MDAESELSQGRGYPLRPAPSPFSNLWTPFLIELHVLAKVRLRTAISGQPAALMVAGGGESLFDQRFGSMEMGGGLHPSHIPGVRPRNRPNETRRLRPSRSFTACLSAWELPPHRRPREGSRPKHRMRRPNWIKKMVIGRIQCLVFGFDWAAMSENTQDYNT